MASGSPPPVTCPIGWQPQALAPVFFGARSINPSEGAPVPLRIFFPSLDGAVESAPLLAGCGRYPLVLLTHGHCIGDPDNYRRWFRLPAQLARSGYVVVVPQLAGIGGGQNPSVLGHPDLETVDRVLRWAREDWEGADVLLPPPATGIVGHSYGALLGARYAVGRPVSAYAGLSGVWHEWLTEVPFPLPRLDLPTLLVWGGGSDFSAHLSESQWQQMRKPRHRVVFAQGEHWDYLGPRINVPCRPGPGSCAGVGAATDDLVTMFFAKYLPPELGTNLPGGVPTNLTPPPLVLTPEQEFFAGGFLNGYAALGTAPECAVTLSSASERLVANIRSKETHSLDHPCVFVNQISNKNRREVGVRPTGFHWCDFCFPGRRDG